MLLKMVVVLARGGAPLVCGLAIGGCLDLLLGPRRDLRHAAAVPGPNSRQRPTNCGWVRSQKVLTPEHTGHLRDGRLAVLAHCRWSFWTGLGPYCLAKLQNHCHGCGGSKQWACRRRVRPLASVPFRGIAEEEHQGSSPKNAWLARCWCIFMPVDLPMATGNSVPYVAERGFSSGTTLWPHGFSFLLNLLHGFCGCVCPTEFLGYLSPVFGRNAM